MQDCKAKGRTTFGERNGQAKLTEADVIQIRSLIARGIQQKQIAPMFGVKPRAINKIHLRLRWAHLP